MAKKNKSLNSIGKKIFKIYWFGFFIVMILIVFFNIIDNNFDSSSEKLADGFTISSYNVILDVKSDNLIDVTENITVNWYENFHHGIYKFTPQWAQYTGKDGKTIKRKAIITNYQAIGEKYTLDTVKKKARIKIGDKNKYVSSGKKEYVIKYTYNMGKDPFKNFDELIFHAFGDYWGTPINNASVEIKLPKNIEDYNINFFADKFRKENVTDVVDYSINGNTIYAKFNENKYYQKKYKNDCNENDNCSEQLLNKYKPLEKSLTIDVELPDGYFTGGSWNYGWYSFLLSIIIFALTIFTIFKWFKFGKDYPKNIETVEFYPPDNLNAAEIGYIFNKQQASKKFTIALIIQLASKGYIKIDEIKDSNIQITNLLKKPKKLKDFNETLPKRQIKIKKLRNIDSNLNKSENSMMKYLFKKSDEKVLEANIDKFLAVKDKLVQDGYIEIISDNESERLKYIDTKKSIYDKELEQYNNDMEIYEKEAKKLLPLSNMERIVYDRLFTTKDIVILSEHHTFYKAFDEVSDELKNNFQDKVYDSISSKQIKGAIIRSIVVLILSIISYVYVEDLDPSWNILYTLSFICNFINLFFIIIMKRKTEYGEYIAAKVRGFRQFLITAEKEQLEKLVLKNPNYFYNILPYTYVLNISKKWIKKFENIPVPDLNIGNFDYSNDNSYYSLYDNVYYPVSTSDSGGCSSCGGGCSSCGGGCSSCGGGGSW